MCLLPHAEKVQVEANLCERKVNRASHAARQWWSWEWRTSGVEKSVHTCFCQWPPLCPLGASLSWICLPLLVCTQNNACTENVTYAQIIWDSIGSNNKIYWTCLGQKCQCFWIDPYSSASPELCARPSYWCISFQAHPAPPSCSSASDNRQLLYSLA